MKLKYYFLVTVMMMVLITACHTRAEKKTSSVLMTTKGDLIVPANYKGKWIFINYWADWCGPCHREVNSLNHFYQQQKNENILLIGVNADNASGRDLDNRIADMGIEFPVVDGDPQDLFHLPDVRGLPTTFVISPQGELVRTLLGPQTEPALEQAMK